MSYRDDFYVLENIIGYTGDRQNLPTVYFEKKGIKGEIEFGRITQQHDDPNNVGRNLVRKAKDYRIENDEDDLCYEFYDGKIQHNSRNKFINATNNETWKVVLAISTVQFPNIKPKYQSL